MIVDLPIPKAQEELNLHRVGSWEDEGSKTNRRNLQGKAKFEESLCPHAVSFGSVIYGIRQVWKEGDPWLTWKTSFSPYQVIRLTSNWDGSIIVCTTDAETVALLRGTDGAVLATRKVPNGEPGTNQFDAHATFIASSQSSDQNEARDAVLIWIPSARGQKTTDFILVSNIDARSLNSTNPIKVGDAARGMTINTSLNFQTGDRVIVSCCGYFVKPDQIRFFLLDDQGRISCHDYTGLESPTTTIANTVKWNENTKESTPIDQSIGLKIHNQHLGQTYVMFATATSIFFLDPTTLRIKGKCTVSSIALSHKEPSKILSLEPMESAIPESGVVIAVVLQPKNRNGALARIVEACVNDQSFGDFHEVYAVPINDNVLSFAAFRGSSQGSYSFRFKVEQKLDNYCACQAFLSSDDSLDGSTIGRIRLLIACDRFDEADALISYTGESALTADNYAHFHPSEVALGRLRYILKQGNVSEKTAMAQARQCFHRLSTGCISGNERAGQNLLDAAESISRWASPSASKNPPTLMEITAAVATVSKVLGEVLKMLPVERHPMFVEKQNQLKDQLATLRHLATIVPTNKEQKLDFERRFQGSRNPGELFASLVANEHFVAAEGLWNSLLRKKIYPRDAINAIVRIGANSDPKVYTGMLEEFILPSLSMKFHLLPPLWNWSCQLADTMDDNDELGKAIDLLQSIERATNKLQRRAHSSFALCSPFIERPAQVQKTKALIVASKNTSFGDGAASPRVATPGEAALAESTQNDFDEVFSLPTVLELGHITRGAIKSRKVLGRLEALDQSKENDAPEDNDSRVRQKLQDAKFLRAARELGLEKRIASLRSFSDCGGKEQIFKELMSALSKTAETHEERSSIFKTKLAPFCQTFDVNLDEALLQYLQSLCASTSASESSIQEAASAARCSEDLVTTCTGILIVLRAALFCRYAPSWLTQLSKDAIEWSSCDLSLRSELVEASRLLLIDGIVRKYIGAAGSELFRVDNPRHAIRLLEYVTQHFERESVLNDALDLSDAFNHLSRLDACTALCSHSISAGRIEFCSEVIEDLYVRDSQLADNTCENIVAFCSELVAECSMALKGNLPQSKVEKLKKSALDGTSAACAVLSILFSRRTRAMESFPPATYSSTKVNFVRLKELKSDFLRLNELQRNHSVFLSFADLRNTSTLITTAANLMSPVVCTYTEGTLDEFKVKLAHCKRACFLLAGAGECKEIELWSAAVSILASPLKWSHDDVLIDFLTDVGLLGGFHESNTICARVALSTSFVLCLKASNGGRNGFDGFNENIGRSVSLVHDYCLATCPENLLIQCQSLSTLTEMVWHVVLRGDEGVGENLEKFRRSLLIKSWSIKYQQSQSDIALPDANIAEEFPCCRAAALHPSWYIGDGLLLPPLEAISNSINFCKDIMNALTVSSRRFSPLASAGIDDMTRFLFHRGALSVSLRLLNCSSVLLLCSGVPNIAYGSLANGILEVFTASAERSLGGTGNGIISQIVDSQHAVSFLLSLPVKLAFKVYKSALPTALSTRDYPRVIALANIGIVAGSGQRGSSSAPLQSAWQNQEKLLAQCKKISNQSIWWRFLKTHRISFDQRLFDEERAAEKARTPYCQKLIQPIIVRLLPMTKKVNDTPVQSILRVLRLYANTFGLRHDSIVETYIEFLLSSPGQDVSPDDARLHLPQVEMSVKELFPHLQPKTKQAFLLRRCICALEKAERSAKDYDRHLLLLQLYRDILHSFMSSKSEKLDRQLLEAELEAIHRRIDALAILSSVFEGERKCDRPAFPAFFKPLPTDFSSYSNLKNQYCSILGKSGSNDAEFDPLEPLHGLLLRSHDLNVSTSLAPLGIPLGLPSGYIHARFLMEHFRLSARQGSTLPSFEQDVLPVFSRIQIPGDKCALAEWCATHYVHRDSDRLNCLELAHGAAIKHSNEAEQRKSRYMRSGSETAAISILAQEEMKGLETVKRLSNLKSSLSDKIKVAAALQKDPALESISKELLQKLEQSLWNSSMAHIAPEGVVDVLLTESSLLAANLSLDDSPLSMQLFRRLSVAVNAACQALAAEHSHIQVGRTAWKMVERWLFNGDDATITNIGVQTNKRKAGPMSPACVAKKASKVLAFEDLKEEDTINFVMDLSAIQDDDPMWTEDAANNSNAEDNRVTSDEERSALKKTEREQAELMTIRTALRVAFVLACHDNGKDDESVEPIDGLRSTTRSAGKSKTGGLLARIEKLGSKQNTYVMACARDLLKIVFAKPDLQCKSRFISDSDRNVGATVTFSMRHRALRSAAVLLPQDALEKVIDEEGYLESGGVATCSLKMCTFGSFVANECEEIGMPLTHSDLGHISSMHFSSYARTLWRHHRDGDQKGSKGRLLLLLLQMSLKDEVNIDAAFVELILKEMKRMHLPRSLLLACEHIAALREEIGTERYDALVLACSETINEGIATTITAIISELREGFAASAAASTDQLLLDVIATLCRLGQVVQCFSTTSEGQSQLSQFVGALTNMVQLLDDHGKYDEKLMGELRHILNCALRHVQEKNPSDHGGTSMMDTKEGNYRV